MSIGMISAYPRICRIPIFSATGLTGRRVLTMVRFVHQVAHIGVLIF